MELRNRAGEPVDPVPFLVVAGTTLSTCYAFGPSYFAALGMALADGVMASTVVFLVAAAVAFRQFVWERRPTVRDEVPMAARMRRYLVTVAAGVAVLALLALPLAVR